MKKSTNEKRRQLLLQHDQHFLNQGFSSLAGVDEAGRGPLAGPVVASAVIVRDFSFSSFVDDSKKMSPKARESAYEEILQKCLVGIGVVEHGVIDRINILQASLRAMESAVLNLKHAPDCLLVDGLRTPTLRCKLFPISDGDAKSFTIACASVIAKVTRDRIMNYYDQLFPQYGFKRHKGYGTAEHLRAIRENGLCEIHRRSFEPIKSLLPRASRQGHSWKRF